MNPGQVDCHTHTSTFSDGMSSVEEMVHAAATGFHGTNREVIPFSELWLTDHSDIANEKMRISQRVPRIITERWKPIYNDIKVVFGVEGDLLNEQGDVCSVIHGKPSSHVILSAHPEPYHGKPELITDGYIKAIIRHGDQIKFIGHLCASYYGKYVDVAAIAAVALEYNIPFELNCANLKSSKTEIDKLTQLLNILDEKNGSLYVNSDAHTLQHLRDLREEGFAFLHKGGWISTRWFIENGY